MTIVFIGDIHQHWHHVQRGLAALTRPPTAAVLLGDIQCERPLDELASPLLARLRHRWALSDDLANLGPGYGVGQRAALAHSLATAAIWPEDVEALGNLKADVLVTHEAPSSHPAGSVVIDSLARRMGARTIVHGHHHVVSHARAADGLRVLGVASAWGATLDGTVLWEGDKPRPLPAFGPGWASIDRGVNQVGDAVQA
jgi:predicted phosphodiesterase